MIIVIMVAMAVGKAETVDGKAEAVDGKAEVVEVVGQAQAVEAVGKVEAVEVVGQAQAVEAVGKVEAVEVVGQAQAVEVVGKVGAAVDGVAMTKYKPTEKPKHSYISHNMLATLCIFFITQKN